MLILCIILESIALILRYSFATDYASITEALSSKYLTFNLKFIGRNQPLFLSTSTNLDITINEIMSHILLHPHNLLK